jgi:hypothetical protein
MDTVVQRSLVIARWDFTLLRVTGDFLSRKCSLQIRLTFGVELLVFGKVVATCSTAGRRPIEIGETLHIEVVERVFVLLCHKTVIPLASGTHEILD